jgi:putative ABC transport system permease protein
MGTVTIAIFVFGLLLQRRREYVTLKAQGLSARSVRGLISAEAATVAVAGCSAGVAVGVVMAAYLVNVLRPLFVLAPPFRIPLGATTQVIASVLVATAMTSIAASSLVNRLQATELLRDERSGRLAQIATAGRTRVASTV